MGKKQALNESAIDLIYQALETEQGGVKIYQTALTCAVEEGLRKEWKDYLEQTKRHVEVVRELMQQLGLDPEKRTPGREVVGLLGQSLVEAMLKAHASGTPEQAEIVACECVVLAETKDHTNWELLGHIAKNGKGEHVAPIRAAVEQVEDEEDHHLYHTKGWCRELWVQALGFPAVIPPPEEQKNVETAIGAARAEKARKDFL